MVPDPRPPLAGVRVLEAARVLAGPFCGQLLADLGADVVKLERPGSGDDTRGWGPPYLGPLSAYFLSCNRGKRSLTLDAATPDGRRILDALLAKSDVLIENFRTDSLPKLGLDPDTLLKKHPRLIVCSISGYGRTGPLQDAPGYDLAVQAQSGLMGMTGPVHGPPCKVAVALVDVLTGLYASTAILAALHARATSGHGYFIDLALHDCALAAQVNVAQYYLTSGELPARQGNAHLQIVPYQLFRTADGWLILNVGNDSQWRDFCAAAGAHDLGKDARFATNRQRVEYRNEVIPKVEAVMATLPTAEWEKRLTAATVPHAVVRNYVQVFSDPAVLARGMKLTVKDVHGKPVELVGNPVHMPGVTFPPAVSPPRLGQHTAEVLKELAGLDAAAVERLRANGTV
jgi:crotonobetainyl-CoA:carnitine CoA-transferase CaiB-like acyl-CoA transferase